MIKYDLKKLQEIVKKSEFYKLKKSGDVGVYYKRLNARSQVVKQVLSAVYGRKNVRVRKDTGTAHYWLQVWVFTNEPKTKNHQKEKERTFLIEGEVRKILKNSGITFAQYYTDLGPNDHYADCLLVDIEFKPST
ncbi:MAG: hypothetical protein HYX20_01820 [Candidatus Yanofskybacteria bacterium]|nr:hypothetical protein [Candidatus Yanofskybacteria bacterium]